MINIVCELIGRCSSIGDCVAINEIEFYNKSDSKISYTVTSEDYYENERGGIL